MPLLKKLKKVIVGVLLVSVLLQPLGLVSAARAETVGTVEMGYTDPDHIHAPKVVDGVEYQYDANGNLVNDGERVISWNQDNLPTKIVKDGQVVEFFYDANGNRIVKKSGGDKTVYVNNFYEQSTINNEQSSTKYYFANGSRVVARHASPSSGAEHALQLHSDHLGSTILATDSNSQPLSNPLSYFPYGSFVNRFEESPLADNLTIQQFNHSSHLFTGQELDPESDLYNYNARLYNPTTGAFISADTVGGGNRYSYAANNPLLFTDPSGHMAAYDAGGGGGGEGGQTTNPDDVLQYEISGGSNTYQPPAITATEPLGGETLQIGNVMENPNHLLQLQSYIAALLVGGTVATSATMKTLADMINIYYVSNPAHLNEIYNLIASVEPVTGPIVLHQSFPEVSPFARGTYNALWQFIDGVHHIYFPTTNAYLGAHEVGHAVGYSSGAVSGEWGHQARRAAEMFADDFAYEFNKAIGNKPEARAARFSYLFSKYYLETLGEVFMGYAPMLENIPAVFMVWTEEIENMILNPYGGPVTN